jgi:hypothetical protein
LEMDVNGSPRLMEEPSWLISTWFFTLLIYKMAFDSVLINLKCKSLKVSTQVQFSLLKVASGRKVPLLSWLWVLWGCETWGRDNNLARWGELVQNRREERSRSSWQQGVTHPMKPPNPLLPPPDLLPGR